MYIYAFEKLQVWQDAKDLVVMIYKMTSKFPSEEKFGLVSQLRRASVSIASNIAEGSGRQTTKDQAYFYNLAYGSTLEVLNQLIIAKELDYIDDENIFLCRQQIEKVSNKLNSLRKSVAGTPQRLNK